MVFYDTIKNFSMASMKYFKMSRENLPANDERMPDGTGGQKQTSDPRCCYFLQKKSVLSTKILAVALLNEINSVEKDPLIKNLQKIRLGCFLFEDTILQKISLRFQVGSILRLLTVLLLILFTQIHVLAKYMQNIVYFES